jgi:rubrerythrin
MKVKTYISYVAIATLLFFAGRLTAGGTLNPQTRDNLMTAMHGEAFAYAKYMLYADRARQHGNHELADLFTKTAKTERFQHFSEMADLAGLVGSDADNLNQAIKGESEEIDNLYRKFAEQASAAGDKAAADRFEEVRNDEMKHRDAFKTALAKLSQ